MRKTRIVLLLLLLTGYEKQKWLSRLIRGTLLPFLLSLGGRYFTIIDALFDAEACKRIYTVVLGSRDAAASSYNLNDICSKLPHRMTAALVAPAVSLPPKCKSKTIYLSFSGCSWLLFYHLGVAAAFLEHFPHSEYTYVCAGSSCGSLVAFALVDKVPLNLIIDFVYNMLHTVNSSTNPIKPFGTMTSIVEGGLKAFLSKGAAERCENRLFCSLSIFTTLVPPKFENKIVGSFSSSDDRMIHTILSSCYIPLYYETSRTMSDSSDGEEESGQTLVLDGGLTENHPAVPKFEAETIFVCPSAKSNGKIHIANRRPLRYPGGMSIIPGDIEDTKLLFEHGQEDGAEFIRNWIQAGNA